MEKKVKKFNQFVTQMDLTPPLNDESLRLIYNEQTSHIWEQIQQIVLSKDVVQAKKDAIYTYQMKGGTTNLFSSDLTEYELNLKIDYEKKEIAKLEEELDNDLEDEQHTSKLDTNHFKLRQLENKIRTAKNAVINYSSNNVEAEDHLRQMEGYFEMLSACNSMFHKCNENHYTMDYERCVEEVANQISNQFITTDVCTCDDANDSLGILNLSSTLDGSVINLADTPKKYSFKSVKSIASEALPEFPDSVLFEFLDKHEKFSGEMSKLANNFVKETNFGYINQILLKELLQRKKYDLKCQIIPKIFHDNNLYSTANTEVFANTLQEEITKLEKDTPTSNVNELKSKLLIEKQKQGGKLIIIKKLMREIQTTYSNILDVNTNLYKILHGSLLEEDLRKKFLPLDKDLFNRHLTILAEYLSDIAKSSSTLHEDLDSLHVQTYRKSDQISKELIKYTTRDPYAILQEYIKKKNFLVALQNVHVSYTIPTTNTLVIDDQYAMKMQKIFGKYNKLLEINERITTDLEVQIKNYEPVEKLFPLERYIPDSLNHVRENYIELFKQFNEVFDKLDISSS